MHLLYIIVVELIGNDFCLKQVFVLFREDMHRVESETMSSGRRIARISAIEKVTKYIKLLYIQIVDWLANIIIVDKQSSSNQFIATKRR